MVTFFLPSGPKNLTTVFPAVEFNNVDEYYLELISTGDPPGVLLTTNHYRRSLCCCDDEYFRLFFVNYQGAIDAVNFKYDEIFTDIKSSMWKKGLTSPLKKFDGGWHRQNITAQTVINGINIDYQEDSMPFLEQLLASPNVWMQWKGIQGQDDNYIPVVVADGKFVTRKSEGRYSYPFLITVTMANDKILLRN